MTRARAKLLEQHVNSLLIEYDVCDYENFILPKSMHLCMIRVVDNTNIDGGKHGGRHGKHGEYFTQVLEGGEGGRSTRRGRGKTCCCMGKHLQCAMGGILPQLGVGLRVLMAEPMLGRFVISWLSPTRVGLGGGAH